MTKTRPDPETFNEMAKGFLPGHLGLNVTYVASGVVDIEMEIAPHHLAPNGYLHAGAIVTLVDTPAGYGCIASLAEGAESFTTIELKSNFVGTARSGLLRAEARLAHGGRTTQVGDRQDHRRERPHPGALSLHADNPLSALKTRSHIL